MDIVIETKRLYLREMNEDDVESLSLFVHSRNRRIPDIEYAKKWIAWCLNSYKENGFGHLAVIYRETGEMIGSAGISMQFIDDEWKPEIGYHLRNDYHHQGLAKEMGIAIRDYFFNNFPFDELYCYMEKENAASYKTAESLGLTFLHLYEPKAGEIYRVYRITRSEWNILSNAGN